MDFHAFIDEDESVRMETIPFIAALGWKRTPELLRDDDVVDEQGQPAGWCRVWTKGNDRMVLVSEVSFPKEKKFARK